MCFYRLFTLEKIFKKTQFDWNSIISISMLMLIGIAFMF